MTQKDNINMAHQIENSDHMFSAGVTPWHGLGTVTAGALDLDTALVTAKLDWTVGKYPAFTRDRDTTYAEVLPQIIAAHAANPTLSFAELLTTIGFDLPIEGAFATVREDLRLPLATVGSDYTVWQNPENFDLAKVLLDGGDVVAETAGSLRDSRTVWLLCRIDRDMTIGGDEMVPYMLFTSSHDGTSKIRVMPTPTRVVCANTLRVAINGAKTQWTTSHTSNLKTRVIAARETLKMTWKYMDEFETMVKKLQEQVVTDLAFEKLVFDMIPEPEKGKDGKVSERAKTNATEKRSLVRKAWERSPEIGEFRGTGWGAAMSFNTVDLWTGRVHGGEDKRLERQAQRILTGDTMANTNKVLELLAV
jgi:phage/plasmid-like protein (TIGR03299 family)